MSFQYQTKRQFVFVYGVTLSFAFAIHFFMKLTRNSIEFRIIFEIKLMFNRNKLYWLASNGVICVFPTCTLWKSDVTTISTIWRCSWTAPKSTTSQISATNASTTTWNTNAPIFGTSAKFPREFFNGRLKNSCEIHYVVFVSAKFWGYNRFGILYVFRLSADLHHHRLKWMPFHRECIHHKDNHPVHPAVDFKICQMPV